jgi:transcriptional regulator with XRE-family HTH domain
MSRVPRRVHPARLVLVDRGLTIRDVAVGTDYSPHWVSRVLRGLDRPSRRFRRALAAYLDLPEAALFRDDERQEGRCGMTPAELREAARKQNDRDHAAGLLPSRYVEDPAVLDRVARLLPGTEHRDGGPTKSRRRHHEAPTEAIPPSRRHAQGSAAARHGGGPRGTG